MIRIVTIGCSKDKDNTVRGCLLLCHILMNLYTQTLSEFDVPPYPPSRDIREDMTSERKRHATRAFRRVLGKDQLTMCNMVVKTTRNFLTSSVE